MSRLDYCNTVPAGVPQSTLKLLQRVQNAAAPLVHQLNVRDHVTPSLMVHWLLSAVVFTSNYVRIHTGRCSAYLEDIIGTVVGLVDFFIFFLSILCVLLLLSRLINATLSVFLIPCRPVLLSF